MDAAIVAWEHHPHWDVGGSFAGCWASGRTCMKMLQHSSKKKKKTKEMKKKQKKMNGWHRLLDWNRHSVPFFWCSCRPLNILLNRLSVCKRRTKGVLVGEQHRRNAFFRCFCFVSVPLFLNLLAAAAADDDAPLQLAGAGDGRLINAVSRTILFYNKWSKPL